MRKGFTLLEVMVALGVFTVGVLISAELHVVVAKGNKRQYQSTVAVYLLSNVLENLKTWDWNSVSDSSGELFYNREFELMPSRVGSHYLVIWATDEFEYYREIRVQAFWNSFGIAPANRGVAQYSIRELSTRILKK